MIKIFGVNYDGRNRRIVAATSQKKAAELIGIPLSSLRSYGGETGNKEEIEIALRDVGAVWSQGYKRDSQWVLVRPGNLDNNRNGC